MLAHFLLLFPASVVKILLKHEHQDKPKKKEMDLSESKEARKIRDMEGDKREVFIDNLESLEVQNYKNPTCH